ncbi:MAG: GNAT family N-acetyltransferase [Burkholderiales bacterium]|nr:GNAT family N-acetyltransferase [Burkholderiales bacterium]
MLREPLPLREARMPRFAVELARTAADVRAAQRLRYAVFAEEMGARLDAPEAGIDADRFDPHCEHLVVREAARGEIVGTYRILSPSAAARAGGYYSEQEFDLARLAPLRAGLVEVGRSCIHPGYRTGAVISLLWAGLARYMLAHRHAHLMGCASIGMADGGYAAAAMYRRIAAAALSPAEYRVVPRHALPLERLTAEAPAEPAPLIKGYLRLGAWVCGAPAWDPAFNTADLLVLLPLARLDARYARRYIGADVVRVPAAPCGAGARLHSAGPRGA